ncbi:hypothetical protein KFK09_029028 [Dendrobium nobile]|uniref:VAN3-binding protein-like n=1 Tax=Dendrobium nobile TaxID=94219 RepID=A0A8T3A4C6_DENNO|nr:hypothetical protein KFK09_029028 [Dendrobium nobile]
MEESRRVSFTFNNSLVPSIFNGRLNAVKAEAKAGKVQKAGKPVGNHTSEVPKSPNQALEFLCRRWSPASSEFFNLLSSQILVPKLEDEKSDENDQVMKEQRLEENVAEFSGGITIMRNHTWAWLSNESFTTSSAKRHNSHHSNWMSVKSMKALLSGELLTRFIRRTHMKRKEKLRLQIAQVHAALSVARLAAAIAGTLANFSMDSVNNWNMAAMPVQGEGWDQKMSMVVASAAALVATVCAEAAEAVGAKRSLISLAIDRGLATQRASEILGLTAAAATCLRGASTLEVRTAANRRISEDKVILVRGIQLLKCSPTGKLQVREVRIYLKHNMLTLRLVKKLLRGTITTHKDYRITNTLEEINNGGCDEAGHGLCSIDLSTNDGHVQLLFEDKKQFLQWKSTISQLLCVKDRQN